MPVGSEIPGDLDQEAPLRAWLDVVDPTSRDDQDALYLVIQIGIRNAHSGQRMPDEADVLIDQRTIR